jgi:predicted nucleic acid-binding protein
MIYLDTSVLLAQLFAEDRKPPPSMWQQPLCSSRLLEYETWARLHAAGRADSHGEAAKLLLGRVSYVELTRDVLARALEPFPAPLRTLDAMHVASMLFLQSHRAVESLATYDSRMRDAAEGLGVPLAF